MKSSDVMRALAPDDQTADEEPLTATLFPLRFLGMGLLIAWLCCTHVVSIFPGLASDVSLRTVFDNGMRFGDVGTFIVLAVLASRIGRLSRFVKTSTCFVGLTMLGTASIGLILIPAEASATLIFCLSILTAIGGAFLFCLWAEAYSQMGMTQTLMYGAGSCIVAGLISFIVSTMQPPFAILATTLLPVFSLACALLSFRILPAERPCSADMRYPLPWKLLGIMAVAGLLSGTAGAGMPGAIWIGAIHRVVATGLAGLVIIVMTLTLKSSVDVRFLAKVTLPLSVIALALIPLSGPEWGFIVSFLIKLAYVWFTIFVLLMLANIAYRFEVPSLRLFATARAISEAAIFIGITFRSTLVQEGFLSNPTLTVGITLGGIVLILVCVVIWMSEKTVNSDWGASGISLSDKLHVPGPRERFMARCDAIAAQYGLTPREQEIMALIAQRKSRAEIEQELFLSQNTVKTHVRHLYAKLGVGSKADVIELLEA
ncbi:helix-turn-helix transcriptional regulator [Eggerthella sp. YY7918]|uniref:helix-turn-helix transcriptional regulator n=1 Tax=Eggerthella sp. (strain YY7918) TaxID=502558 RepID=UPI00021712A6|nr:helix-turn-helix transcriptional regulator [Eggerthella sp. YY7918]BAK45842.1 CsgD [Eggerthella sp. YY7918]